MVATKSDLRRLAAWRLSMSRAFSSATAVACAMPSVSRPEAVPVQQHADDPVAAADGRIERGGVLDAAEERRRRQVLSLGARDLDQRAGAEALEERHAVGRVLHLLERVAYRVG
jgi:hypothetical protein